MDIVVRVRCATTTAISCVQQQPGGIADAETSIWVAEVVWLPRLAIAGVPVYDQYAVGNPG